MSDMTTSFQQLSSSRQTKTLFTAVGLYDSSSTLFCKGAFASMNRNAAWLSAWSIAQRDVVILYKSCDGTWRTYCKFSMTTHGSYFDSKLSEAFDLADACAAAPTSTPTAAPTVSPTAAPTASVTIDWDAASGWGSGSFDAGTRLQFEWSGSHNVYLLPSEAAYNSCDFSGATLLGSSSPLTYDIPTSTNTSLYFACSVGSHCNSGQKLEVEVRTLSPTSAPTAPVTSPATTVGSAQITQEATFSTLSASQWQGDVKTVYEAAYGIATGIYNMQTQQWNVGSTVSSEVQARRGITVVFAVHVPPVQAAATLSAASQTTGAALVGYITAANTALGLGVVAPAASTVGVGAASDGSGGSSSSDGNVMLIVVVVSALVGVIAVVAVAALCCHCMRAAEVHEGHRRDATVMHMAADPGEPPAYNAGVPYKGPQNA